MISILSEKYNRSMVNKILDSSDPQIRRIGDRRKNALDSFILQIWNLDTKMTFVEQDVRL